ncbi:MAG TPA: tRNA glutamyl-Q(34) synthetase GluQRS [Propionicimonas sp.]|jgi:glutamyl-tRNA synthetase|nr:tRNA glutamyl-Q(34) synthetase GluQRS [Propionicimonas sp.]
MSIPGAGRFAPSPTSDLHLGNLRTAVLAWLFARSSGRRFLVRIEDLDTARVRAGGDTAGRQLADLAALGLDFDGDPVWQSQRLEVYRDVIASLPTYPCFCTRREIAEAASAPHHAAGGYRPYPGTCRNLTEAQRAERAAVRTPALRVRAQDVSWTVRDALAGEVTAVVDDFVVARNDGTPAYNLAVVVDDLASGVDQVVRGDDLLDSSPRQAWLAHRVGGSAPDYAHVPLALNPSGQRLAKRDGAVCMADLARLDVSPERILSRIAESLALAEPGEPVSLELLLTRFDPALIPRRPWLVAADYCW